MIISRESRRRFRETKRLAKTGDISAKKELAGMYSCGSGVVQDGLKAIRMLTPLAEQGDPDAQLKLHFVYDFFENDEDGSSDKFRSLSLMWLRRSAVAGNAHAQCILGGKYQFDPYVKRNLSEAVKWCELSMLQGFDDAFGAIIDLYTDNEILGGKERLDYWYRYAAEHGNGGAQCHFANLYFEGKDVEKDISEAIRWYRLAAENDDLEAQMKLGLMYTRGEEVDIDSDEAFKWFMRANRDREARYRLGVAYTKGLGVERNAEEGAKWYTMAAKGGHGLAQEEFPDYNKGMITTKKRFWKRK